LKKKVSASEDGSCLAQGPILNKSGGLNFEQKQITPEKV
jgi:hypothetical protein